MNTTPLSIEEQAAVNFLTDYAAERTEVNYQDYVIAAMKAKVQHISAYCVEQIIWDKPVVFPATYQRFKKII